MILTGKAKHDFFKWLSSEYKYLYCNPTRWFLVQNETNQHSMLMKWIDHTNIYMEVFKTFDDFHFLLKKGRYVGITKSRCGWGNRQEATKQAIIKANELYNESNRVEDRELDCT